MQRFVYELSLVTDHVPRSLTIECQAASPTFDTRVLKIAEKQE
jgi:hypothetical protein